MKITLRTRDKNEKKYFYLDYYDSRKRKTISLNLFLYNPKPPKKLTVLQKQHNKQTELLAQSILSKRILEAQNRTHGFQDIGKLKSSFIEYYIKQMNLRFNSAGNYGNWKSALIYIKAFSNGYDILFSEIDENWLERFKNFLIEDARTKSNTKLSRNSCYSYFNKVRACLNQATKDRIIFNSPGDNVKGIREAETHREFLTLEEVKLLIKTECHIEILKSAFIFSCLTGMRWSDINKLTWKEVCYSEETGWYIRFKQKKTKQLETLNVSEEAIRFLPTERADDESRVFVGLKYSAWHNVRLREWVMRAGIKKSITFHSARHTYATLLLTNGVDIYTVSQMLGHKHLKTTEIYAKIVSEKKRVAANSIKLNL